MAEAAHLVVWLVGLFGIVGTVCLCVAKMVINDTIAYDETFVWKRKLPPEAKASKR